MALTLKILDMTGLNPALHENVFWTDFAKISHIVHERNKLKSLLFRFH